MIIIVVVIKINNGPGFLGEHFACPETELSDEYPVKQAFAWIAECPDQICIQLPAKKKNCIQVLATRPLLGVGSDWRMQPLGDAL